MAGGDPEAQDISVPVKPSSAWATASLAWVSLCGLSPRSPVHFTGRATRVAAQTTNTSSGKTPPFMPKPPPTSGADDPETAGRFVENRLGQYGTHAVRTLLAAPKSRMIISPALAGQTSTRFHGIGGQAVIGPGCVKTFTDFSVRRGCGFIPICKKNHR